MNNLSKENRQRLIIGILALAKLAIHLITLNNYELHRDALLYYSLGEHLDWGYVSVPPFTPFISYIATSIFGNSNFALRIFPAIIGSVSVIVIAKIVKQLNGGTLAVFIATFAFVISPAFLRSNSLFQPVTFNQFFWLLSAYFIIKLLNTQKPVFWLSVFLVWGIAFLNKYSIAFFIVASLSALLLTPHRKLLFNKYFFIGGIMAILIILPNLVWQYRHNWPLIHHMTELQQTQFVNVTISGFLMDQLMMNIHGIVVWIAGLVVFLFFKAEKKYRAFAFIYLFTVLILLLLRGKSYYTLGLYSILFALGGYGVEKYFRKPWIYVTTALMILISIPLIPFSLPVLNHDDMAAYSKPFSPFTNRWEDGEIHELPQDYADMTGWKEMAHLVIGYYEALPENEKNNCILYAENYGQAGALKFYGKNHNLPQPVCFNDNFLLWAPTQINKTNLIYVNDEIGEIKLVFRSCVKIGEVDNKYFRERGLQVHYCKEPKILFRKFYEEKVADLKSRYQ